jgi:hypothetical protein
MSGCARLRTHRAVSASVLLLGASAGSGGCAIAHLVAGMAQNEEYQKQVLTPPEYPGLENQRVAVLVDADLAYLYEYPELIKKITAGLTLRIGRDVPGASVVHPDNIVAWQWRTPQWNAMAYGEMIDILNVDRIVYVDLDEFRLNPPGNRWLWEGVCSANISVIERDAVDPDAFAATYPVAAAFPTVKGVDRQSATAGQIEMGVLSDFIKKSAWLFHEHLEPKHPDKFRPELQANRQ